jgi:hypothetical protein
LAAPEGCPSADADGPVKVADEGRDEAAWVPDWIVDGWVFTESPFFVERTKLYFKKIHCTFLKYKNL